MSLVFRWPRFLLWPNENFCPRTVTSELMAIYCKIDRSRGQIIFLFEKKTATTDGKTLGECSDLANMKSAPTIKRADAPESPQEVE